jgi:hypothetical protein
MDCTKNSLAVSDRRDLRYLYFSFVLYIPFYLYIKSIVSIILKRQISMLLPYHVFCITQYLFDTLLSSFVVSPQSSFSFITVFISYFN